MLFSEGQSFSLTKSYFQCKKKKICAVEKLMAVFLVSMNAFATSVP